MTRLFYFDGRAFHLKVLLTGCELLLLKKYIWDIIKL